MATSETEIARAAVTSIGGAGTFAGLGEDTAARNREARVCLTHFGTARDAALADFDWPFARRRLPLALLDEDPPDGWLFAYAKPEDSLAVRKVIQPSASNPALPQPFETGQNADGTQDAIFTNIASAVAICTVKTEDPNRWSPWFVAAITARLAMLIEKPLTGKRTPDTDQEYALAIRRAQDAARREGRAPEAPEASWIAGRE